MPNFLSPYLQPLGMDPTQGYDTAAAGAKDAQAQANALSQLQWQRQMMGLQGAMGQVSNLQSLYNSIYGPGGGQPAAGGGPAPGPTMTQMSALASAPGMTPPPQAPQKAPSVGGAVSSLAKLGARSSAAMLTGGLSETSAGRKVQDYASKAYDKTIGRLF